MLYNGLLQFEAEMEPTTSAKVTSTPVFPAEVVATCLQDELIAAAKAEAGLKGTVLSGALNQVANSAVEIDSLTVVECLCALDDVLPFEVGESVVRAGGYNSIESAVKHVVARIEKEWYEHHKGGKA